MTDSGEGVRAHIAPVAPLLRRGLVRAAVAAGFTIVDDASAADISLQVGRPTSDSRSRRPAAVDVVVSRDEVTLHVRRAPDARLSSMLQVLLAQLLDHAGQGVRDPIGRET